MNTRTNIKNFNGEIWKEIQGLEGLYQVSNLGRVKSFKRNKNGELLKIHLTKKGYSCVCLRKNGKTIGRYIHRLVYDAFIGDLPEWEIGAENNMEINHIDEDKTNNCVWNLELVTHKQNANYGTRNKRSSEKNSIPINQFTLQGVLVKKWNKFRDLSKYGFNRKSVAYCCKHNFKFKGNNVYRGYIWEYAEKGKHDFY